MYTSHTKNNGELVYYTIKTPLKVNDFAYCTETREVIQIAEIMTEDHFYKDTEGNVHYDNFDPWNWLKIVKTNDHRIYEHSDQVESLTMREYRNALII